MRDAARIKIVEGGETRFHSVQNGLGLVTEPGLIAVTTPCAASCRFRLYGIVVDRRDTGCYSRDSGKGQHQGRG